MTDKDFYIFLAGIGFIISVFLLDNLLAKLRDYWKFKKDANMWAAHSGTTSTILECNHLNNVFYCSKCGQDILNSLKSDGQDNPIQKEEKKPKVNQKI